MEELVSLFGLWMKAGSAQDEGNQLLKEIQTERGGIGLSLHKETVCSRGTKEGKTQESHSETEQGV